MGAQCSSEGGIPAGKPKLFYWGIAGRGELARLIAAAGGIEMDEEPAVEDKLSFGSPGSLPVLQHGDLKMAQSTAIENYLCSIAPKFSVLSKAEKGKDMMFCSIKEDVLAGCAKAIFANKDKSNCPTDVPTHCDKWFAVVESLCPASGFVNGKPFPTAADLAVLNMTTGYMPFGAAFKHGKYEFASKYPKMKALADRAAAAPGVKEYLATTGTTAGAMAGM
jgi:glutathione S-transferase